MSILRHIVGIAAELLDLNDPYDKPVDVKILGTRQESNRSLRGDPRSGCRTVTVIQANNYRDLERYTNGQTAEGNRSTVCTRVGHNRWEISTEEWDVDDL